MPNFENENLTSESERGSCSEKDGSFRASEYHSKPSPILAHDHSHCPHTTISSASNLHQTLKSKRKPPSQPAARSHFNQNTKS